MKGTLIILAVAVALAAPPSFGQRGIGDATGLARQGANPDIVTLTGTISDLLIEPCAMTTGRSIVGAHVIIAMPGRADVNLHLGPATELAELVADLQKGDAITAFAFRSDALPADAYIARDLKVEDTSYVLRDASLRPVWAGVRDENPTRGMGPGGRRGPGRGR